MYIQCFGFRDSIIRVLYCIDFIYEHFLIIFPLALIYNFYLPHTQVSNLLLQVFDEGRLSDSKGNAVDYRNTVILMTSNLGSDMLARVTLDDDEEEKEGGDNTSGSAGDDSKKKNGSNSGSGKDGSAPDKEDGSLSDVVTAAIEKSKLEVRKKSISSMSPEERELALRRKKTEIATKLVHSHFSPEFVNRLDDVIVFNPLSKEAMLRICRIQLEKVTKLLQDREIKLLISEEAVQLLALKGTDILYGARPMKRLIQNTLLNPLATLILKVL